MAYVVGRWILRRVRRGLLADEAMLADLAILHRPPELAAGVTALAVIGGALAGPVVWVLISEMFPNRVRAAAVGIATASNWVANFLVSATFPALADWNLSVTYGGYAVMAALSFFVVWRFVTETRGRTLEAAG